MSGDYTTELILRIGRGSNELRVSECNTNYYCFPPLPVTFFSKCGVSKELLT